MFGPAAVLREAKPPQSVISPAAHEHKTTFCIVGWASNTGGDDIGLAVAKTLQGATLPPSFLVAFHAKNVGKDVQTTYDLNPGDDKKLHWIKDGDTRRFIGFNSLGEHPETMVEFFNTHIGVTASRLPVLWSSQKSGLPRNGSFAFVCFFKSSFAPLRG